MTYAKIEMMGFFFIYSFNYNVNKKIENVSVVNLLYNSHVMNDENGFQGRLFVCVGGILNWKYIKIIIFYINTLKLFKKLIKIIKFLNKKYFKKHKLS